MLPKSLSPVQGIGQLQIDTAAPPDATRTATAMEIPNDANPDSSSQEESLIVEFDSFATSPAAYHDQQNQQEQEKQQKQQQEGRAAPSPPPYTLHDCESSLSKGPVSKKATGETTIQSENTQPSPLSQRQQQQQAGTTLARVGTISTSTSSSKFIAYDAPKTKPLKAAAKKRLEKSQIEIGPGPAVLIAIGKTGQGKMCEQAIEQTIIDNPLKTVTKGIAERTGWGQFEDNKRILVTLADTPGLAHTEGDDDKHIPFLKEYVASVGKRLGINAFLLVFKIDSSVNHVMAILKSFNEIMQDFPDVWENVILVFTGCDHKRKVHDAKETLHRELRNQIKEHFPRNNRPSLSTGSSFASMVSPASTSSKSNTANANQSKSSTSVIDSPKPLPQRSATMFECTNGSGAEANGVPMVFLSAAENICAMALGGQRCDCSEHAQYLKLGLKRLWNEVKKMERWVIDRDYGQDESRHE
ncbi:hypothetical protein BGZ58_005933 [Dissophora ornata]|nr:hypothetical protein BGZ58_005933 [Dissophora ornata]